jgi:MoaA/NifB/PqqE/SkfB family radical SAM enzyme
MNEERKNKVKGERLHILINSFCNNGCIFCSDVHKDNTSNFKILEKYAEADLKRMKGKVKKVLFASGEPTLSKRLVFFVSLAKKYGYESIDVVTNGRKLANEAFCRELLGAGLTEFNVSLHGSRKEVHEKLTRAPGSFDEAFLGLCNLSFLKRDYKFSFYVNFLLNKINYKDLENFLRLMLTFDGLQGIVLNTVLPKGGADRFFEKVVPLYSQVGREVVKVLTKLMPVIKERRLEIFLLGLPPCLLRGFERNIIDYESALIRDGFMKTKSNLSKAKWEDKAYGPLCVNCRARNTCSGVWVSYIKKNGWGEFKPVK